MRYWIAKIDPLGLDHDSRSILGGMLAKADEVGLELSDLTADMFFEWASEVDEELGSLDDYDGSGTALGEALAATYGL